MLAGCTLAALRGRGRGGGPSPLPFPLPRQLSRRAPRGQNKRRRDARNTPSTGAKPLHPLAVWSPAPPGDPCDPCHRPASRSLPPQLRPQLWLALEVPSSVCTASETSIPSLTDHGRRSARQSLASLRVALAFSPPVAASRLQRLPNLALDRSHSLHALVGSRRVVSRQRRLLSPDAGMLASPRRLGRPQLDPRRPVGPARRSPPLRPAVVQRCRLAH